MKGRLIANGILSLVWTVIFIIIISLFISAVKDVEVDANGHAKHVSGATASKFAGAGLLWAILVIVGIAQLVMGIVTLSTEKSEHAKGLTIASGILAILAGAFGAGCIVSFIAAKKVSDAG